MTISVTSRVAGPFPGNGSTTVFNFTFKVFAASDLYVVHTNTVGAETVLTLGSHYSATLNANQNSNPGGYITMATAPATGEKVTITTRVPRLQGVQLPNAGGWYPEVVETALDKLTVIVQELAEEVGRSVKTQISSSISPDQLVDAVFTAASNAAASASSAATSASSATASANSAAASYDSFDDRYLGPKSSAPTLDNDGNALLTGALYFDTVANQMYVWNGTTWASLGSAFYYVRQVGTATQGQTSISATYTPGYLDVYVNGVQLAPADYTATNGTSITVPPMQAGDVFVVLAYNLANIANAIPATSGSVTSTYLASGSVTAAKIAYGALKEGPTSYSTASGTQVNVSIPSGVREVDICFVNVSLSGTDRFRLRLGAGSTPETTGYAATEGYTTSAGTASATAYTDAFTFPGADASSAASGLISLRLADVSSNRWVASGTLALTGGASTVSVLVQGTVALPGALGIIRLAATGSNSFDGGYIAVSLR